MRTTIEINDAIYKKIVKTNGKRNISNTINDILSRYFLKKKKKDMFGVDSWLKKKGTGDLRDEYDRDI
jgi:predicted CopG family antitoxin